MRSSIVVNLLVILTAFIASTQACSCAPRTFEELFEKNQFVDAVYVIGQAKVKNGRFIRYSRPTDVVKDINAPRYYRVIQMKSVKGCNGQVGNTYLYKTNGNSASCGVNLEQGWYLLSSHSDPEEPQLKQLGSCSSVIRTYDDYSPEEHRYVQNNTQVCKE